MTPLTRRDRHAMLLALDALRVDVLEYGDAVGAPFEVLAYGPDWLRDAVWLARHDLLVANWRTAHRWLRARLALALRALLRADRGDYGPKPESPVLAWLVERHGAVGAPHVSFAQWAAANGVRWSRRVTPWWQQPDVPATGTAARPAGLRRRGGLQ